MKSYSELITIPTFQERYDYLRFGKPIGFDTFGEYRYLNQQFYVSSEWKRIAREIAIRDNGMDMATPEWPIHGSIIVHHIEPLTIEDFLEHSPKLLDPENLISVSFNTHNAIHFGTRRSLAYQLNERSPRDTTLW